MSRICEVLSILLLWRFFAFLSKLKVLLSLLESNSEKEEYEFHPTSVSVPPLSLGVAT